MAKEKTKPKSQQKGREKILHGHQFRTSAKFSHCGAKFSHCGAKFSHCGAKFSHCGAKFSHYGAKFTHCGAKFSASLLSLLLLLLSF